MDRKVSRKLEVKLVRIVVFRLLCPDAKAGTTKKETFLFNRKN
jgi:hypothetical protein